MPLLQAAENQATISVEAVTGVDVPAQSWLVHHLQATAAVVRVSLARAQSQIAEARARAHAALDSAPARVPFLHAWVLWELSAVELSAGNLADAQTALATLMNSRAERLLLMNQSAQVATRSSPMAPATPA